MKRFGLTISQVREFSVSDRVPDFDWFTGRAPGFEKHRVRAFPSFSISFFSVRRELPKRVRGGSGEEGR